MADLVNYGLIGAGMMGREHLANLALIPGTRVAAIHEPDPGQLALALAMAPGAVALPSARALVDHPGIDALVVASPNHTHADVLAAIARGPRRPVLVEKPVVTDPAEAAALAPLADWPVWVAMEYRYMPPMAALIAEAEAATGGILMLTIREHRYPFLPKVGNWNRFNARTGGTLVEKCCHFFDLMRLMLRDEPVRVMATGGQAVNHRDERIDGRMPDIWDHAYVIVDFARGARAMLELCMFAEGARFQEHISAVGPAGKIEALIPGPRRFWPESAGPAPVPELVLSPRQPAGEIRRPVAVPAELNAAGDHQGATYFQHRRFLEMIHSGTRPEVSLADGLAAVALGRAAEQSARTGQSVTLPPTPGAASGLVDP